MTANSNRVLSSFTEASKIFPKIVYKYRVWDTEEHKTILTDRLVWFAAPSSFPDPLDCKNPIRYDLLSKKQVYEIYLLSSKENNVNYSRQQHRKDARDWAKKNLLKNKEHLNKIEIESSNDFNSRVGILSLTANPANKYMWEKYSQNHSGFVVGFNPLIAFKYFGGGRKVEYVDKLPIIYPRPINEFMKQIELQVYYKLNKWYSEEEYRVQKFDFINPFDEYRKVNLPPEAYSEIIFGAKINPVAKNEIISTVKEIMPHIKLKQAQLNDSDEIFIRDE